MENDEIENILLWVAGWLEPIRNGAPHTQTPEFYENMERRLLSAVALRQLEKGRLVAALPMRS